MHKRIDEPTGTQTVGHEWDGIEELDTPMPRWWLWTLYLTIIFAIGYVIAYPAIPMLNRGSEGMLGWTSRGGLAAETREANARHAAMLRQIADTPIEQLPGKPELMQAAVAGGRAAFRVNCVQCHGAGAAGVPGLYPNLNDDDWLWGGNLREIEQTITHGIRQPGDGQTRTSLMPSFGRDGMLTPGQIQDVVSHVRTLSGKEKASAASARGAAIYADNCAACHGPAGQGGRQFGAPDLTDAIWLYGGSRDAITATLTNAHAGVMPAWANRLDAVTIRMLAAYVHSLGGGEDFTAAPAAPASDAPEAKADVRP
ncbi:MAG: cytochrome-c oxidase, cbb3-type subunit III [Novosphingobium sp.]|jgi:cytochrome c oxidase cbb3-type subunit 3|nr:cytochrome-c oxidase, cbb3-type subunit III [Novosphingobium sp.]